MTSLVETYFWKSWRIDTVDNLVSRTCRVIAKDSLNAV